MIFKSKEIKKLKHQVLKLELQQVEIMSILGVRKIVIKKLVAEVGELQKLKETVKDLIKMLKSQGIDFKEVNKL